MSGVYCFVALTLMGVFVIGGFKIGLILCEKYNIGYEWSLIGALFGVITYVSLFLFIVDYYTQN